MKCVLEESPFQHPSLLNSLHDEKWHSTFGRNNFHFSLGFPSYMHGVHFPVLSFQLFSPLISACWTIHAIWKTFCSWFPLLGYFCFPIQYCDHDHTCMGTVNKYQHHLHAPCYQTISSPTAPAPWSPPWPVSLILSSLPVTCRVLMSPFDPVHWAVTNGNITIQNLQTCFINSLYLPIRLMAEGKRLIAIYERPVPIISPLNGVGIWNISGRLP